MTQQGFQKRFLQGMKDGVPVILGFVPVGIAYAIMARPAGLTVGQTCGMSLAVFAGASQMMAVGMYEQGAGLFAIVLATFILNLRHLIMSTCVMNRMEDGSTGARMAAAFGVTDESFAIFTTVSREKCRVAYLFGLVAVTYASWNVGTLVGAVASDLLPDVLSASLGIALYAMFIGLLVPNLTHNRRLGALVVFTALCSTLLSRVMASSWALVCATLLCAFVGVFFVDLPGEGGEEAAHADR